MKGETAEKRWSGSTRDQLEAAVRKAVRARAPDFKAKASSLTFEGARRMIEQDLRMKQFSLDAHKKYFKRCMEECISTDDGEETPEPSRCTESKAEKSTVEEPGEAQNTSELNNGASNFDEAPASSDTEIRNENNEVSEDMIKEAIKERALFFKENLETISLMRVRRLLEEDLKLPTKALDVHKAFISTELEKALASLEMNKSENGAQKKPKKGFQKVEKSQASKASKRTHEDSCSSDNSSKDSRVEKKRKLAVSKVKESTKNSASQKNSVDKKKSIASSKSKKVKKIERRDDSDEEREAGNSSDKNESRSSDDEEDAKKRREKPTPQVYGKKVEHLKGIIKSCGLGIPPAVYRRAKQVPEDKREACLIKELEEILEKEGLSTNPSEKEIKEVKKRKERAKELEGIDTSNIITSSRRRGSAFSYIPPPKPPKLELSSDDDDDDEDDDDEDDDVDLEKGDANDDDEDGDGDGDGDGDEGNDDGDQGGDKDNGDGDTNDSGNHRGGEGNDNKGDEDKGSGQDGADDSH